MWDAWEELRRRRGSPTLREIAADRDRYGDLFDVAEALLDHDEALGLWRFRHVQMVERQLGSKSGTGGSTGASYLRYYYRQEAVSRVVGAAVRAQVPGFRQSAPRSLGIPRPDG